MPYSPPGAPLPPAESGPIPLPSASSASRVVRGDWTAIPTAMGHTLGRAALMAPALVLAGTTVARRGRGNPMLKNGLWWKAPIAGALAIETFVFAYYMYNGAGKDPARQVA